MEDTDEKEAWMRDARAEGLLKDSKDWVSEEQYPGGAWLTDIFDCFLLQNVWERDGCIASDVFERLIVADDFPQGVKFHRVSGAGHFLHQEKPEVVNPLLLDWLNQYSHHR